MIVNIPAKGTTNHSRSALISWVNNTLNTNFVKIEELKSGAAYCQLMDILFVDLVPIKRVKFCTSSEREYLQNFKILQASFYKMKVDKNIPVESLMKGRSAAHLEFLQWFYKFFASNYDNKEYDAQAVRNHEVISTTPDKINRSKSASRADAKRYDSGQGDEETVPQPNRSRLTTRGLRKFIAEYDEERERTIRPAQARRGRSYLSSSSDERTEFDDEIDVGVELRRSPSASSVGYSTILPVSKSTGAIPKRKFSQSVSNREVEQLRCVVIDMQISTERLEEEKYLYHSKILEFERICLLNDDDIMDKNEEVLEKIKDILSEPLVMTDRMLDMSTEFLESHSTEDI